MNAIAAALLVFLALLTQACGADSGADWVDADKLGQSEQEWVARPLGPVILGYNELGGFIPCNASNSAQGCVYPVSNNIETTQLVVSYGDLPSGMRAAVPQITGGWNAQVAPPTYRQLSISAQSANGNGLGEIRFDLIWTGNTDTSDCFSMSNYVWPDSHSCNGVWLTGNVPPGQWHAQCNLIVVKVDLAMYDTCKQFLQSYTGASQSDVDWSLNWQIPAHGLAMAIGLGKYYGSGLFKGDPTRDKVLPLAVPLVPGWLSSRSRCLLGRTNFTRNTMALQPGIDPLASVINFTTCP